MILPILNTKRSGGRLTHLRIPVNLLRNLKIAFNNMFYGSATFEHMFPPFIERESEVAKKTSLPALTTPPQIRVRHIDKSSKIQSNKITSEIRVYRDDELFFSIENMGDYSSTAEVHWIVRNQDEEAMRVNDLGHTSVQGVGDERYEGCSYSGTHYMECLVLDQNDIKGIGAVKVRIVGFSRPVRNPPRKKHFRS